jgi:hypothetical protein
VTIHAGDVVQVELHGSPSFAWTAPRAGDPAVVTTKQSTADSSTGNASGIFVGRAPGQTQVQATQDPGCRKTTPACGAPSRVFMITVRVVASG